VFIDAFFLKALGEFLQEKPSAYLDEMVDFLWEEFEISVDKSTVGKALKKAQISRKHVISVTIFQLYDNHYNSFKDEHRSVAKSSGMIGLLD
jgi:hypothetical protein